MSTGGNLPGEMIVEILVRLPTKSLGRFKCVSKYWRTFITDPNFAKTHLNRNNCRRRRPKLLICDRQFVDVVDIAGEPPYVSSPEIDFEKTHDWWWYHIYGTCNGLILGQTDDLILLKPTTQECKKLPKSPLQNAHYRILAHGFGYDSTSDDYKVVVISYARLVYVYSLRNDSWKRVGDWPFDHDQIATHHLRGYSGAFLNGCIHWIGFVSFSVSKIIAFDLADEKFKTLPLPHELRSLASKVPYFGLCQVSGCLVCWKGAYCIDFQEFDVWVMKDYGVESSWTKYCGVTKSKYVRFLGYEHFRPVFYLPNEELVLIHDEVIDGINVVTYNVKEKTSTNVTIPGISCRFDLMCTFQDSLVSPEHFNRETTPCLH